MIFRSSSLLALFFILPSFGESSTFVGNGGNGADIELQVTLNQIQNTLRSIQTEKDSQVVNLCSCYDRYKERAVCSHLNTLSSEQVQFCAKTLRANIGKVLSVLEQNPPLQYRWTTESMSVQENSGKRAADAVAYPSSKTLTINTDRFLDSTVSQRIFLIAHEIFHFVEDDTQNFRDDIEYPFFPGPEGGRKLINAMASSIAVESYDYSWHNKFLAPLNRSQGHRTHWLAIGAQSTPLRPSHESIYDLKNIPGFTVGYRYQDGAIGYLIEYGKAKDDHVEYDTITINEIRDHIGLGASYRWYPTYEPMSFWGQSHFLISLRVEMMKATLEADDGTAGLGKIEDTVTSTAPAVQISYYLPFVNGFWAHVDVKYSTHSLEYKNFNLEYESNNITYGIGASYAF